MQKSKSPVNYQVVQEYWDSHPLGTQFLSENCANIEFVQHFVELDNAMERWSYKNEIVDWLANKFKTGLLLEIGCGLGTDLVKFGKRGFSIVGIDLAPTVVAMARRHLKAYRLPGMITQGNGESLAFRSETFDVVYSCGVLQHTPNIEKAVNEIHRVVRKGGIAVVIVYHRYSLFNLLRITTNTNVEFEDKDPPIINTYSKKELYRIFSMFEQVEINVEYCYPTPTLRKGILPYIYNNGFIPIMTRIPHAIIKNFGWHVVVKAQK